MRRSTRVAASDELDRSPVLIQQRPVVYGKFIHADGRKFYPAGVTYGPFRPDGNGCTYNNPDVARRDFAAMAAHGINCIRTYTCPPRWILDVAQQQGLRV